MPVFLLVSLLCVVTLTAAVVVAIAASAALVTTNHVYTFNATEFDYREMKESQ